MADDLQILPLTPERWGDLEELFGPRGASGGCWCMYFRLKRSEFEKCKGEGNRRALKSIVDSKEIPGLLANSNAVPVGWISIAPREAFPLLDRSRVMKRVDDQPVWSIVCFFIAKSHRRSGISRALIDAALDFARQNGVKIVEAYPVEPKKDQTPDVFAYHGLASSFLKAGFIEAARRSETRPIMRFFL